jgi:uncharacterized protein DUF11
MLWNSRITGFTLQTVFLIGVLPGAASAELIAVGRGTGRLLKIDPITGVVSNLSLTNPTLTLVFGASSAADPGKLWATENGSQLYEIEVGTGVASPRGSFFGATTVINELAYDVGAGVLYGTNNSDLYIVDGATANTSRVGPFGSGIDQMFAMVYVPGYGLYGIDGFYKALWSVNTSNGAATMVGPTGLADTTRTVTDIAWDTSSFALIGTASNTAAVYKISLSTGSAQLLNDTSVPFVSGVGEMSSPPADLAISGGGADRVKQDARLHCGVEVVNLGPNPAAGVVLRAVFPNGLSLLDAKPSQGSCTDSGNILACNVGSLGVAQAFSVAITLQVAAPRGTTLESTFGVFSAGSDVNLTNNVFTKTTAVK